MNTPLLMLCSGVAMAMAMTSPADAAESPKKLLVVTTTTGFRHSSIPTAEKVLLQLAKESGAFTVEFISQPPGEPTPPRRPPPPRTGAAPEQEAAAKAAQDKFAQDQAAYQTAKSNWDQQMKQALAKLAPAALKDYDGVIFANTTGDLPIPDRDGFLEWLKSGKAFIGMHAAGDTFHGWPGFLDMIGGEFLTHGPQVGVECLNEDPAHPANAALGKTWQIPQEEIYQFKNYDPAKVHELLIMDKHPNLKTPGHYPVSWCRDYGKGKIFYTSFGHREDIWDTDPNIRDRKNPVEISQAYQAHILGGIKWALGLAPAKP